MIATVEEKKVIVEQKRRKMTLLHNNAVSHVAMYTEESYNWNWETILTYLIQEPIVIYHPCPHNLHFFLAHITRTSFSIHLTWVAIETCTRLRGKKEILPHATNSKLQEYYMNISIKQEFATFLASSPTFTCKDFHRLPV